MSAGQLRFVPAALWAGLIWWSSSFDWAALGWGLHAGAGLLPLWLPADKLVHGLVYATLGWLLRRPMRLQGARALAVALGLTIAWGLCDEVHQSFVPGRFADVMDLLADAVGGAIGAGLASGRALAASDQRQLSGDRDA